MPAERRCARDGASARTHTTTPESKEPDEVGPDVSADGFVLFPEQKDSTVRAKPQ